MCVAAQFTNLSGFQAVMNGMRRSVSGRLVKAVSRRDWWVQWLSAGPRRAAAASRDIFPTDSVNFALEIGTVSESSVLQTV